MLSVLYLVLVTRISSNLAPTTSFITLNCRTIVLVLQRASFTMWKGWKLSHQQVRDDHSSPVKKTSEI